MEKVEMEMNVFLSQSYSPEVKMFNILVYIYITQTLHFTYILKSKWLYKCCYAHFLHLNYNWPIFLYIQTFQATSFFLTKAL